MGPTFLVRLFLDIMVFDFPNALIIYTNVNLATAFI